MRWRSWASTSSTSFQSLQSWSSTFRDRERLALTLSLSRSAGEGTLDGQRVRMTPSPAKRERAGARAIVITLSPISEVLAEPVADAADEAVRLLARGTVRFRRLDVGLDGVGEEADAGGEGGAAGGLGEAADADRPAHADLLVEHHGGELARAGELAGAAGQHDAAAGDLVEAAGLEARAHQLEGLLEARLHDADEDRFRDRRRLRRVVLADLRHADHLALVGGRGDAVAVERLHALGVDERRREAAGDVVRDVCAAHRQAVGVDDVAVEEDGDGGGAAAHVDDGDAEVHLVLYEGGEAGGVGRDDQRLDVEMAALDAGLQVAQRPGGGGDEVHVDAEPLAIHAARIADAAAAVDGVADGNRMDEAAVLAAVQMAAMVECS